MITEQKNKSLIQQKMGVLIFLICILLGSVFFVDSRQYAFSWFIGLAFGYVLQKSRFCFTAGFRDSHMLGNTVVGRSVLVALGLTTIGFTLIKYVYVILHQPIPGMNAINPIGLYTLFGGILFGIGMVIAGGCATGVLMRIGDGFFIQIVVLIFFILGNFLGAKDVIWWQDHFSWIRAGVFLPDIMGWLGSLIAQLIVIILLYFFATYWERKKIDD